MNLKILSLALLLAGIGGGLTFSHPAHAAAPDPATVGTWQLPVAGGTWIWIIRRNGTYDFHSEPASIGIPHHGKFEAHDGQWSLQATTGYADSGTYQMAESATMVATGHLGTANWQRTTPQATAGVQPQPAPVKQPDAAATDVAQALAGMAAGAIRKNQAGPVFDGHGGMFNCNPCNGPIQK